MRVPMILLGLAALTACGDKVEPVPQPAPGLGDNSSGELLTDRCGETYRRGQRPPNPDPSVPCR